MILTNLRNLLDAITDQHVGIILLNKQKQEIDPELKGVVNYLLDGQFNHFTENSKELTTTSTTVSTIESKKSDQLFFTNLFNRSFFVANIEQDINFKTSYISEKLKNIIGIGIKNSSETQNKLMIIGKFGKTNSQTLLKAIPEDHNLKFEFFSLKSD